MSSVAKCHLNKNILFSTFSKQNIKYFSAFSNEHNQCLLHRKWEAPVPSVYHQILPVSNITSILRSPISRSYCSDQEDRQRQIKTPRLPPLMAFPKIIWPSFFKTIKNWILINFIIRPYFDREFDIQEFAVGTKHALQIISRCLTSGDLQELKGLVAEDSISELQASVSRMSVAQRSEVCVDKEDVYFTFPYQVGIMFDETNEEIQKRFVEITMVFHSLRGLKEMKERGEVIPLNIGMMPEYRDKISICNYRFIKEFTQNMESDWTVNIVNHFKPSDFLDDDDE